MKKLLVLLLSVLLFPSTPALAIIDAASIQIPEQVSMQPYTKPAYLPSNVGTYTTTPANECQGVNETRDTCYLRYKAAKDEKTGIYFLVSNNLQCPPYYFPVATLGDSIYNVSEPANPLYFYNELDVTGVSQADYVAWTSAGATCTYDYTQPVGNEDRITWGTSLGCCANHVNNNPFPSYKLDAQGRVGLVGNVSNYDQDTTKCGYAEACQHYTASGCPSWCAYATHEVRTYYLARCKRPAGFYKAPASFSSSDLTARSTVYTPSTVICSKPNVSWQQAPGMAAPAQEPPADQPAQP